MNIKNKYTNLGKGILSGVLCAGVLTASMGSQANTQQEVSQVPLGLSEGVPPNMIFTLDESGSMSWGYTPDNIVSVGESRRILSNIFNSQYYNPNVAYKIPPAFNKDGIEYQLSTSFSNAYHNGFQPDGKIILTKQECGWLGCYRVDTGVVLNSGLNLTNGYRVTQEHRIPDPRGTFTQLANPAIDFKLYGTLTNAKAEGVVGLPSGFKINYKSTGSGKYQKTTCDVVLNEFSYNTNVCSYDIKREVWTLGFDLTETAVPAYYYVYNSKNDSSCTIDNEDCYSIKFVTASSGTGPAGKDERENFAIWFSFYKTRALATLSATSIAFYDLSSDVRFTWQNLDTCKKFDGTDTSNCGNNSLKPYTSKHKGEFYTWLRSVYFNVGTPLPAAMSRAGEYLKTSTPWEKFPGEKSKNTTENTYACRPSYHVLMTDGMWNKGTTDPESFRKDDSTFTTPDGETKSGMAYSEIKPFYDSNSTTLADIAMHYWATDLRPKLDNKVPVFIPYKSANSINEYWDPRNNPAEWQHMSNFIMGLGLTNSLNDENIPWVGATHSGEGYKKLISGASNWPKAYSYITYDSRGRPTDNGGDKNVYDLWHAAINSRGEFYSVDTPEAMVQAFKDILTRIADRKSSAAAPGTSTSLESDGAEEDAADRLASYFYQTSFDSGDGWAGDIQKVKKYRKYNKDTNTFEDVVEQGWSAKQKMPAPNSRKIMIAGDGASKLKAFSTTNAGDPGTGGSLASYLNVNPEPGTQVATWQQRLEYLRGSSARAGEDVGKLRPRSSILGDFLSSQPVIVKGARYLEGFANRLESPETGTPTTTYSTFMASIANRRGQLYVGGNDGMLHAFDTATGKEKFAFIPTAVFPKLNKLTGKNYTHEYYVDGTPVVADVYDSTASKWRTILVGTLRAGGKGLFALDITDPDNIQLLWELDESSEAVKKLAVKPGYSFPQPTVARLHNGQWAVVTGNGYKGEGTNNGAAALYVINAITGVMIKSLEVQSPNAAGGENGLSSPRLADYDSDGVADYAYAGDLHGNLWRFDLLGAGASAPTVTPPSNGSYGAINSPTTFSVSYDGKPMFTATSTVGGKLQPITSAPSLVRHPTRKGYLVMFGTGKYFEIGDKTGEESFAQTVYGIWDMKTKAEATSADTVSRSKLQQQTITSATTGTGKTTKVERDARIISNNAVEWYTDFDSSKPVNKRGWYLDLTLGGFDGEMMIENMRSLGSMLLLQTLVPNDDPCANGSTNWYYAINPATGGRTLHHAFDTRAKDGDKDVIVSAIKYGTEGGVPLSQDEEGFKIGDERVFPPPASIGRQSWRIVPDA